MVIVGPTASGKSALALAVAKRFGGEIVNCDSVQIYRGFDVGSSKVPPAERHGVPHHLLDWAEPGEVFTAGDYRRQAVPVIERLGQAGRLPVLVGGTGLYLRALLLGLFEGPPRSEDLRTRLKTLAERHRRSQQHFLHKLLSRLDAEAAARIHPRDEQKIIRAVEVCLVSRQPMTRLLERGRQGLEGFEALKIGLDPERAELYARINRRAEVMFETGILEETRSVLARPDAARVGALRALGYAQAVLVIQGRMGLEEAVRETQAATRRYAKRQMTWFRREKDVSWFRGFGHDPLIQKQVLNRLWGRIPGG